MYLADQSKHCALSTIPGVGIMRRLIARVPKLSTCVYRHVWRARRRRGGEGGEAGVIIRV